MKRRFILSCVPAAAMLQLLPSSAQAQRVYRIGVLSDSVLRQYIPVLGILPSLGYVEGRNLGIDFRFAAGKVELLPALAAELVATRPDLILGVSNSEIAALKRATTQIPIVMIWGNAPVEMGLIGSLARPGGNITGTTSTAPGLIGKFLEVLKAAIPGLRRVTTVQDPDYPGMALYRRSMDKAALALQLDLVYLDVRNVQDVNLALASIERSRPDAVAFGMTGVIIREIDRIVKQVTLLKLPAHYSARGPVSNFGGLMSYAPDFMEMGRRNAAMIDRILKGARPGTIPVEEPTRYLLSINLKAAKEIGLALPSSLLLRADEVIE